MSNAETERLFPDVPFAVESDADPYWQAAAEGRLVLPQCAEDGAFIWPPRPFCPRHMTSEIGWKEVAGGGVVYTYTIVHRGEGAFAETSPYVLAYVELDEGPRILTNLVTPEGRPVTDVGVGRRVVARFAPSVDDTPPVLRFVLVA